MRSLPFWFVGLATIFAFAGMVLGIYMAASQDHSLASAHAHINLLGWASMAIYGLYYKVVPSAAASRLAPAHFGLSLLGAVLLGPGIALAITGQPMLAQVASILVVLSMALFALIVFTNRAGLTNAQ